MSFKKFASTGLLVSFVAACGGAADHPESASICMATLAYKNAWSDAPTGGEVEFGTYTGKEGSHIHKFISSNGRYVFACEVKGSRVYAAQAPTALGGNPQIDYNRNDVIYTFKIVSDVIELEISYDGQPPEKASFILPDIKGKL